MAKRACIDGNEAAARIAYLLSEVVAIYPITPSSTMGELADSWASQSRPNLWGTVPEVVEMQSEAGAAGALHGAIQGGSLATSFTASQGLLLMIPNMFKIAGELSPAVLHVAARALATHALSIFGDHSDVMAARGTGWAMLASSTVQQAQDFALVAHAAALESRLPFLHFFDGFRTSHEVNTVDLLDEADVAALVSEDAVLAHRQRRLTPDAPVLRGSAHNPDTFFQAREAANPFHDAVPTIVGDLLDRLAERTGRRYGLVEWTGAPDAERAVVVMGSGASAVKRAVRALASAGEKVGCLEVHLYRPFPAAAFAATLPETVRAVSVLDRTKEPGAVGEPLFQDVLCALAEAGRQVPVCVGGRYGLSSKEFTPAMASGVFANISAPQPKRHFTVGIVDDVSHTHIPSAELPPVEMRHTRAVFHGLGADGTVSSTKASVKIIGEHTDQHAQGYFVYDSKKSGSRTVSHLRFGPDPIEAPWLIEKSDFIACHQFGFLERVDILHNARRGAKVLLNCPHPVEEVWDNLPAEVQRNVIDLELELWVVDGDRVAREAGMGQRINTVMQPCFFALSGVLPQAEAIEAIKANVERTYGRLGRPVVERNFAAIDMAVGALHRVPVPAEVTSSQHVLPPVPPEAPEFVQRVTAAILAGEGDHLPVSAFAPDGTWPTATAQWERRAIAQELPDWDESLCIDCAKCAIVCPHAAIRIKVYDPALLSSAPEGFRSKSFRSREAPGLNLTVQIAPDDCTGCGVCADVCPARSKTEVKHKSLDMVPAAQIRDRERPLWDFFCSLPDAPPEGLAAESVKGSQARRPLFEFSGACSGCGETPYLKLLTQLYGDRMLVANATGCSSIYGGNLPTTPWAVDDAGRGPAWANSLFEDNAEFGLGIRLSYERQVAEARALLAGLAPHVGDDLVTDVLALSIDDPWSEAQVAEQRRRVAAVKDRLEAISSRNGEGGEVSASARRLLGIVDALVRKSVWIVGGDGWAYDIGSGGLDHVLASGRNVNVIVLDTEVYSNTGGQASKATPRAAVAKFATGGKATPKKDLGLLAQSYGNVYVAQVAMGSSDIQTVKAIVEADAWPGPSLIIAYSTCIAHGIDMSRSMQHQKDAVACGYWPLYRYHPGTAADAHPFKLDSKPPKAPLADFLAEEARFAMLARSDPERAAALADLARADVEERWRFYTQLAGMERTLAAKPDADPATEAEAAQEEEPVTEA